MSKSNGYVPKHCHHCRSGLGYVRINGKMLYTAKWDTPEAVAKYDRIIAAWLASGRELPIERTSPAAYQIRDLVADYLVAFEEEHEGSRQPETLRYAVEPLLRMFPKDNVAEFRPSELKTLRRHLIEKGLSRNTINTRIRMIKAMFAWGVEEERVHPDVANALQAVRNLGRRSAGVKQPTRVKPVPDDQIGAVLGYLPAPVAAMVQVQRLAGMRPGEVTLMRGADIDMETHEPTWVYKPVKHKNQWRNHERAVPLGPKARSLLRPFLDSRLPAAFLFSPKEAEEERRSKNRAARKSKETPSQLQRRRRARSKPKSRVADRYDVHSYRRAIKRACVKAEVPAWSPHQLRHSAATEICREHGMEASRTVLGHSAPDVTAIYVERDLGLARRVMEEMG